MQRLEALRGFDVHTFEALLGFFGQDVLYRIGVVGREIGVLVKLGFEALHFFEVANEGCTRLVTLELWHSLGGARQALGFHEVF